MSVVLRGIWLSTYFKYAESQIPCAAPAIAGSRIYFFYIKVRVALIQKTSHLKTKIYFILKNKKPDRLLSVRLFDFTVSHVSKSLSNDKILCPLYNIVHIFHSKSLPVIFNILKY